jgi:NitT/TauT family transport system substrate-binding protein
VIGILVVAASGLMACGGEDAPGAGTASATLRLGYFPNVTHAPAIVGVERRIFERALGADVKLETKTFNAGPQVVEAMLSGSLDASYIGPNPAINAYAKDKASIRIVAGATSGGAALVVKPSITTPADLRGKKLATPQRGNTQDVALRAWLADQGLSSELAGGGDVTILPQENAQTLDTFRTGAIDGAWVPEPWVTRLVDEGGGKVLVDEKSLWPGGEFVTTHLIVRAQFLEDHPDAVKKLLEGHVEAIEFVTANGAEAQRLTNTGIERITGKRLGDAVMEGAWKNLTFTDDPIASSLTTSAEHAEAVGLLDDVDLTGIYDLTLLNEVLTAKGEKEVTGG